MEDRWMKEQKKSLSRQVQGILPYYLGLNSANLLWLAGSSLYLTNHKRRWSHHPCRMTLNSSAWSQAGNEGDVRFMDQEGETDKREEGWWEDGKTHCIDTFPIVHIKNTVKCVSLIGLSPLSDPPIRWGGGSTEIWIILCSHQCRLYRYMNPNADTTIKGSTFSPITFTPVSCISLWKPLLSCFPNSYHDNNHI